MKNLQQLRDEAVRIRGEMEMLRNTIEHWNCTHPLEPFIDPEEYQPKSEIEGMTKFIEQCDKRLVQ